MGRSRDRRVPLASMDVPMMDMFAANGIPLSSSVLCRPPPRHFHLPRVPPPVMRGVKRCAPWDDEAPKRPRTRPRSAASPFPHSDPTKRTLDVCIDSWAKRARTTGPACYEWCFPDEAYGPHETFQADEPVLDEFDCSGIDDTGTTNGGPPQAHVAVLESGEVLVRVAHGDGTLQRVILEKPAC